MSFASRLLKNQSKSSRIKPRKNARLIHALEELELRSLFSGSIFVTLVDDVNGNGAIDAGENGLNNWEVFLDTNHNGVRDGGEKSGKSNIDGEVPKFTGLANGTYAVTAVVQPGYAPSAGSNVVTNVVVNNSDMEPFVYFTPTVGGDVDGTVWNDLNGDGVWDATDPGISGWTVYIDKNNNSVLDAGDLSAVTDANGYYLISNVTPGTYKLRQVVQTAYEPTLGYDTNTDVTVTVGGTSTKDWGNRALTHGSIKGNVWNDLNANGLRDAGDPGLDGWTVYLDTNNNGFLDTNEQFTTTDPLGVYTFPTVIAGTYNVREDLQAGWNISPGHSVVNTITVTDNVTTVSDFANWSPAVGSISGSVWNDANSNGIFDIGESSMSGVTIFIDSNSDGILNPGEQSDITSSSGAYTLTGISAGTYIVREVIPIGSSPTAPGTGMQTVTVPNGTNLTGINFGNKVRTDGEISGTVFDDVNKNGIRDAGEKGLMGITVYIDANNNGFLDAGEKSIVSSIDLFYTPAVNEAGNYSFDKLAAGNYVIREIVPVPQNATPASAQVKNIALVGGEVRTGVNFGNIFRANEIHGVKFDDVNKNHIRDAGEPTQGGVTVFIDTNRNNLLDAGEPSTITGPDGTYAFTGLTPGAYVVRAILSSTHSTSFPATVGGILWPAGVSNPARGNVSSNVPLTFSLVQGQTYNATVSITLPNTGGLTNAADVFLLFDDTGSFTGNSPIVRAAFPQIISALQTSLPGMDLGFGVGRLEEYGNFAAEYGTGRPFVLNQPIVAQSTAGYATAIQAALDRTTPGYGGDQPETDIEALYQTVTGAGFDGNNNGTTTDSGAAGLANTQINPGTSGDVPAFSSFTPDAANNVLAPDGTIGGAGFRAGALPIILLATDTGFAYQPKGESVITGLNGTSIPVSQMTQLSRNTTPFNSGAGIQETITALNALGAEVIGLGTNVETNLDPRQQLSAISKLTGAVNTTTGTIANGTATPIAPGDPFYFQIASGFSSSVANGVIAAIQNAVTNTSVNIELKSSDPTVQISMTPSVINNVGAGQTATFNVTFTGDGRPHRFDLQFVKQGTNVVIGSLPVVIGTPIAGDGYEYEDLEEGEIENSGDFGSYSVSPVGGVISGQIFEDRNSDDVHDASEPAEAGVVVYLDLNNNHNLDNGEPSTLTDSSGNYTFTGIGDGSYYVRQVAPTGKAIDEHNVSLSASSATSTNFSNIPIHFSDHSGNTTFRVSGSGARTNISVDGVPTYSILKSAVPSLTFDATAGDDTVVVDYSASDPNPAGGIVFSGGNANDLVEVHGSGAGDNFSISSAGAIAHGAASLTYTGTKRVKLFDGDYDVTTDLGDLDLTVSGLAAHANLRRSQHLNKLTIDGGALINSDSTDTTSPAMVVSNMTITNGKLAIAPDGGVSGVVKVGSLSLGATGLIDLSNNDLVIDYGTGASPAAAIRSAIQSGLPLLGGAGISGIGSSDPTLGVDGTILGVIDNGDIAGQITSISGFSDFTASSVIVKFTWFGDTNFDGHVDGSDYALLDSGFTSGGSLGGWIFGDLDYNGVVNGSDYALIDTGFIQQNSVL